MKKILFTQFILVFLVVNFSYAKNYTGEISLQKNLKNDYKIIGAIDYRSNKTGLYQRQYDIGGAKEINKKWILSAVYRHIYRKNSDDWRLHEKRSFVQITNISEAKLFSFKTRFRHEYRDFRNSNNSRSRLRFQVGLDKYLLNLKPSLSNEFYYDLRRSRYAKNRIDAGFYFREFLGILPGVFYRNDRVLQDNSWWRSNDILLLRIKARF